MNSATAKLVNPRSATDRPADRPESLLAAVTAASAGPVPAPRPSADLPVTTTVAARAGRSRPVERWPLAEYTDRDPLSWRPRLVATDLDGTLLRTDGAVSERTRDCLRRLGESGIPVVGATGRGPRLLDLIRADLSVDPEPNGVVVCAQGGYVADLATGDVLFAARLDPSVVGAIVADLEALVGPLWIAVEDATDHFAPLRVEQGFTWPFRSDPTISLPRARVLDRDVLKFFAGPVRDSSVDLDTLLAAARAVIPPEVAEVTYSGLDFIEVSPPGVTKASGLAIAADRHGVAAADILCFGDMPNDLPMFEWVGWSVAMANAHPELIAVADDVTADNDGDGVAVYLEAMFRW